MKINIQAHFPTLFFWRKLKEYWIHWLIVFSYIHIWFLLRSIVKIPLSSKKIEKYFENPELNDHLYRLPFGFFHFQFFRFIEFFRTWRILIFLCYFSISQIVFNFHRFFFEYFFLSRKWLVRRRVVFLCVYFIPLKTLCRRLSAEICIF